MGLLGTIGGGIVGGLAGPLGMVTGAAAGNRLQEGGLGGLRGVLFGEDPADVELDPRFAELAAAREELRKRLLGLSSGAEESAAVRALRAAGEAGAENLAAEQMGIARGARGSSSLGALRQAAANTASGRANVLGQTNRAIAQQSTADQMGAMQMLAQAIDAEQRGLMSEEEMRRAQARQGILPVIGAAGGGLLGGYLGGPQGMQAGFGLGKGFGDVFSQWGR